MRPVVQPVVVPAAPFRTGVPVTGQIVIVRPQIDRPADARLIHDERPEIEMAVVRPSGAGLESQEQRLRVIPCTARQEHFAPAEAGCRRQCGDLAGQRLVPEQIERAHGVRPPAQQPVVFGDAVRKTKPVAKPEQRRLGLTPRVGVRVVETLAAGARAMQWEQARRDRALDGSRDPGPCPATVVSGSRVRTLYQAVYSQ